MFFPGGRDPDDADGYGKRPVKMFVQRGFDAVQGSESLPPQSPSPSPSRGKSSGKGGKPAPESRFHSTSRRGSSDLKDEVNEGFSSNLGDFGAVGHCGAQGWNGQHRVGGLVPWKTASHLSKGSHLIMLSKDGLVQMAAAFHSGEIKRGHIDLVLKAWLPTGNTAERVGAC